MVKVKILNNDQLLVKGYQFASHFNDLKNGNRLCLMS